VPNKSEIIMDKMIVATTIPLMPDMLLGPLIWNASPQTRHLRNEMLDGRICSGHKQGDQRRMVRQRPRAANEIG
jgi:hypothetical protein